MLRNTGDTTMSLFEELLSKIKFGDCLKRSHLNEDVVEARDNVGTLLHHAAKYGHVTAAKLLMELGSKVDLFVAGRTPLMLAVRSIHRKSVAIVELLLRANANIELTNDEGRSALAMVLERIFFDSRIRAFIRKFLANDRTSDEIAEILINAGGNMCHAVLLKDMKLMECMLERGIDVDSRDQWGRTGLHAAARGDGVIFVEWLIEHGANVNAMCDNAETPLSLTAWNVSKDTMKILLEHGADPNLKVAVDPLYAFFHTIKPEDVECLELLLQYGAIPRNSSLLPVTMFDLALDQSSDEVIWMLISQLAMLEKRGVSFDKSVMRCKGIRHQSRNPEFEMFYETCLRLLESPVFGKLSLCDLLNESESKLEMMARNEEFVAEVRKVCLELTELNSYCCKRVMERIDKASRAVMLMNVAIRVVCKLLKGNYHECYVFARKVVDYLDICDLEKLVVIAKTFQT